jgi:ribose transport system substrate-binding protein
VFMGVLIFSISVGSLFASGRRGSMEEKEGPTVIGLAMHFMRDDYAVNVIAAAEEVVAQHPGSQLVMTDANADPQKQLNDVENLVAQNVDALIIIPFDEKAILPGIEKANEKGIPVVAITYIPNAKVISTIGGDGDYKNGKASGELLVKTIGGKGKIAVIDLGFSLWRIDQRIEGFMDAIEGTDIEIVARQSGVAQNEVQDIVTSILVAHPDLDGIWATFSNQIVGAADALQAANRKDVALTGIDADKAIIERIKDGWITGTAAQFPKVHGKLAAEAAFNYLEGKKVEPDYDVPVALVTPENADEMNQKIWGD